MRLVRIDIGLLLLCVLALRQLAILLLELYHVLHKSRLFHASFQRLCELVQPDLMSRYRPSEHVIFQKPLHLQLDSDPIDV